MAITINGTNGLTTDNGALKLDTDTLVVDDTNNRVGIGTSSPTAQLHIKGTDTTDQVIIENTDAGSTSAPDLILYRNSASPAVDDYITKFAFRGNNNLGTEIDYASIFAQSDNVTSGSEAGSISFRSYNSEIMRINSTGVGIGTSLPDGKLDVESSTSNHLTLTRTGVGNYSFAVGASNALQIKNDGTQRMRLDSSGTFFVGTALNNASDGGFVVSAIGTICVGNSAGSSGHEFGTFRRSGSQIGSITQSGTTGVSYNTSSDYRLKENVVEITNGIDRVKLLNPSRFNFISDSDITVDGFLAHEVQEVVPEAIAGAKDATKEEEYEVTPAVLDDDGNVVTEAVMGTRTVPDYQGIDQSKLVPLLTAALQEAITKIEALEAQEAITKIEALEARVTALENA